MCDADVHPAALVGSPPAILLYYAVGNGRNRMWRTACIGTTGQREQEGKT